MLATPSIARQRIVLVVFLILIGAAVGWQNAGGGMTRPVQKISPTVVPRVVGELDFTSAEAAWRGLQIDSQGNLQIDALTESALLDALVLVNEEPAGISKARMAFLLEKQFGATASAQIMELLPRLQRYKEAEQRWWAENGGVDPPPHTELFELQDRMLGEALAKELFAEQRRLVELMLASQQIRNDVSLTEMERERALMELQKGAQAADASNE